MQVVAAGFCHSDLQVLQGQFSSPLGMIPSHEPAGVVVQVGAACGGGFGVGDRVGVLNFRRACGSCSGCRLGRRRTTAVAAPGRQHDDDDARFCSARETAGFQHDGAFAEYLVADARTTVRLPDGLSFEQAAPLMCAGATVWGSLEAATAGLVRDGSEAVGIVGIGGLGHLGLQFCRSLGFRAVAVDSRAAGLALARDVLLVEDDVVDDNDVVVDLADESRAMDHVFRLTHGEGLAAVVVCTDSLAANAWALRTLRIGGRLGLLGLPAQPWRFDADVLVFRELTIHGSYVASRAATERMLQCVERDGGRKIRSHVTVITWAEIPHIVAMYGEEGFRGRLVVRI